MAEDNKTVGGKTAASKPVSNKAVKADVLENKTPKRDAFHGVGGAYEMVNGKRVRKQLNKGGDHE